MPVIDLANLIENRTSSQSLHTRIVIVKSLVSNIPATIGLLCERATQIIEIDESNLKFSCVHATTFSFLAGIVTLNKETFQIFNVDEFFRKYQADIGINAHSVIADEAAAPVKKNHESHKAAKEDSQGEFSPEEATPPCVKEDLAEAPAAGVRS